jgi:hypothetical protein
LAAKKIEKPSKDGRFQAFFLENARLYWGLCFSIYRTINACERQRFQ